MSHDSPLSRVNRSPCSGHSSHPIRCALSTIPEYDQPSRLVAAQLRGNGEVEMCVELRPWEESNEEIDLWLWLVGKTNHAIALSRLNAAEHRGPACPVIAVTVDLEAHQITELLSAGV